jgi:uncharacterized protein (TIGR02231 family)
VDIVRRAEIEQHSGEDCADVPLSVSTLRTAGGTSAAELGPLIVRYRPPQQLDQVRLREMAPQSLAAGGSLDAKKDSNLAPPVPMQEAEAVADSGGYQAVYRIAGKSSVLSGESSKSFRLSSSTVVPELVIKSPPELDASAFIEASFKHVEEAPLVPGRTLICRDGIYVGQGRMPLTPRDEKVRIGFGVDEEVKVERITVRKNVTTPSGVAGYLAKSKTEERIQVRGPQRPRHRNRGPDRGPPPGQRERRDQGRSAARICAAQRTGRPRPPRHSGLDAGHQAELRPVAILRSARVVAQGARPGHRLRLVCH